MMQPILRQRLVALLVGAALLPGCSTLYPVEPNYDEPVLISTGSGEALPRLTPVKSAHLISGWRASMESAAQSRHTANLVASEILFYGTLLAFAGAGGNFAHANRVRNVGAGAVAGSTLFTSHYQQEVQRVAFRKAADRLICAERAASPMGLVEPEILFSDAELSAANIRDQISLVPTHTRRFIDKQRSELQAALQAVTLQPLTKEQWDDLLTRSKGAENLAHAKSISFTSQKAASTPRTVRELNALLKPQMGTGVTDAQIEAARIRIARSDAELDLLKDQYIRALEKYPTELEFCLANQQQ
jgi:hypothetical protein